MKLEQLQDLFVHNLKDMYSAENQILKALPKMVEAAETPELKSAFEEHLKQTQGQVQRLEQVFDKIKEKPGGVVCKGMKGLLEEGQELIEEKADPAVRDAGLIEAAQKVEHYEIAGYGTLRTYANLLGFKDVAGLLQQTLDEEGATDKKLTRLAEGIVNKEAAAA